MVAAARTVVDEVLTPAPAAGVLVAVALEGAPLDVLVDRFATNRSAIYKTMFDARRMVRAHLVTQGGLADVDAAVRRTQ